jgi:hypothetical protein
MNHFAGATGLGAKKTNNPKKVERPSADDQERFNGGLEVGGDGNASRRN